MAGSKPGRFARAWGEIVGRPVREAAMAGDEIDADLSYSGGGSAYFTPITKSKRRDLSPYDHDRMVQISAHLYSRNPLARRIIDTRVNYVLGEGVTVSAANEMVQAVIDRFWSDGHNRVSRRQASWLRSLRGYSELILPCTVNPVNGHVRLGYVAPDAVKDVETAASNPHDTTRVILKAMLKDSTEPVSFDAVRLVDDPNDEAYGRMRGACFFFAANRLPDQARGTSDLFAIADYLDAYESIMWDLTDRASLVNSMLWQVILEGYTPEQVQKWWDDNGQGKPPRAASVLATNEKVKWVPLTPDFAGADAAAWSDLILSTIATGADLPKMWLNAQDDPNRASAESLAGPSFKSLSEVQNEWRDVLTDIVQFVIDQAVLAGVLPEDVDESFTITMPEMSERVFGDVATALGQATMSLSTLRAEQLLDRDTALQVVAMLVSRLGVDVDVDALKERIDGEAGTGADGGVEPSVYDRVPSPFVVPVGTDDAAAVVAPDADAAAAVNDGQVADAAAMSAAKVAVLIEYAKAVKAGELGRDEAIAQIEYTFNVPTEQAARFVGQPAPRGPSPVGAVEAA